MPAISAPPPDSAHALPPSPLAPARFPQVSHGPPRGQVPRRPPGTLFAAVKETRERGGVGVGGIREEKAVTPAGGIRTRARHVQRKRRFGVFAPERQLESI